jgi:hypothetical protein
MKTQISRDTPVKWYENPKRQNYDPVAVCRHWRLSAKAQTHANHPNLLMAPDDGLSPWCRILDAIGPSFLKGGINSCGSIPLILCFFIAFSQSYYRHFGIGMAPAKANVDEINE